MLRKGVLYNALFGNADIRMEFGIGMDAQLYKSVNKENSGPYIVQYIWVVQRYL